MGLAQQLKRLARMVPGVAGYQDMEALRDTDRMVRIRLAADLRECERDIEGVKRRLMEKKDLALLPGLDYLTAKMEKLSNVLRYAGQGYRGLFDPYPVDQEKLEQLYAFDLRLFDEVHAIQEKVGALEEKSADPSAIKETIHHLDEDLDQLERVFSTRCNVITIH
ncbi:MAG: hypothetical protein EPO39_09365 [Candidatus Manganitrophaceae bacterium]|nr:MAG: hypothetical protein EPO39_09365 [Candidatus Manganitrophaceae bacterium]